MSSLTPSISNRVSLKNLAQSQYNGRISLKSLIQSSYNANNTYYDPYFSAVALLCHFDGTSGTTTFTDSSSNNKTLSIVTAGTQILNTQQVFGNCSLGSSTGTAFSISTTNITFGSSDFTIEFWLYPTANNLIIMSNTTGGMAVNLWQISLNSTNYILFTYNTTSITSTTTPVTLNKWNNIAITRAANTMYIFINGIIQSLTGAAPTISIDSANSPLYIGRTITGFMDEVRITIGYARYIATFGPLNIPFPIFSTNYDPYFGNVALLLHCESLIDSSINNYTLTGSPTFTPNIGGNTTKSLNITNSNGLIKTSDSFISLGSQPFTIEFNIYIQTGAVQPAVPYIIGNTVNGTYNLNKWYIYLNSLKINLNVFNNSSTAQLITGTTVLATNTWYHIAIVKTSTTISLYINGILDGTNVAYTGSIDGGIKNIITIGSDGSSTWFLSGYLDQIRISTNIARYTRNFPKPSYSPSVVTMSSLKGNTNLYTPVLYLDANSTNTNTWNDLSGYGYTFNITSSAISNNNNGLNYLNFNTSSAISTLPAGVPLTLGGNSTFIVFTQPQIYQSFIRTLYSSGNAGTATYPNVSINVATNSLGTFSTVSTFNSLFDTSTISSTFNMLIFKNQGTTTQFKYNNQSALNYLSISQTLPSSIYSIGGFGSSQYWGNIGAVLAYNTILTDAQISDIYNRFTNRFIYNIPPVDSMTVSLNVLSVSGSIITLASQVTLNIVVGQIVKFTNIPANSGISPYLSYYIKQIVSSASDTYDSNLINTKIKVALSTSGNEVVFPHAFTISSITGTNTFTVSNATGLAVFTGVQMNINSPSTNGLISGTNYNITAISGNTVTISGATMTTIAACAIPFTISSSSVIGANYIVTSTTSTTITVNTVIGLSQNMSVEYLTKVYTILSIDTNNNILTVTGTGLISASGISVSLYIVTNSYTTMNLPTVYTITDTYTGANIFKVSNSAGLSPGIRVQFSGTVPNNLKNISIASDYYVLSVPDSTSFILSATLNGPALNVTNNTAISGLYLNVFTKYYILSASSIGNLFYAASVNYLSINARVQFSSSIGGVNTATVYTITSINVATNSFTISIGSGIISATSCINMTLNGIAAYYSGDSFVSGSGVWYDIMSQNYISLGAGNLKVYTLSKKDSTNTTIQALNYYTYLGGTVTSRITFPQLINTSAYTIVWVARYAGVTVNINLDSDSGSGSSKYIFTNITDANATGDYTTAYKWISGFNNGTSGVALHNNWSATGTALGNNWIIGVDQNNLFRANGVTISPTGNSASGIFKIGINDSNSQNPSDFMIASIMIFNYTIPISNILALENWLSAKYNIPLNLHILDGLTAKGAYGVFRLSSIYTGPTLKIRKATGSAISDFYADINGNLGTALNGTGQSLVSWLGTDTTAFIDTWYDQSGYGNHATQSTTGNQPLYDLANGWIDFTGNKYFALPDGTVPSANSAYTVTIRYNTVNSTTNSVATFLSSGSGTSLSGNTFAVTRSTNQTGGTYVNYWTSTSVDFSAYSDSTINANPNTISYTYSSTDNIKFYSNNKVGLPGAISGTRVSTTKNNYIGVNNTGAGQYLNGQLYYLCIFDSLLDNTTRTKVEMANRIPVQVTGFTAYSIGYTNVKLQWDMPKMPTAYVKITWAATDTSTNTNTSATSYIPNIYGNTFDTITSSITLNTSSQYTFTITPYNLADTPGQTATVTVTTRDPALISYATSSTINSFTYTFIPTEGFDSYLLSYYNLTRSIVYQITQINNSTFTYTNTAAFTLLYQNAPVQFYITNNDYSNPIPNSIVTYGTTYYIKTVTNTTFTLSSTVGGNALTFTNSNAYLTLVLSSYSVTASTAGTHGTFTYTNPDSSSTKLSQWTPVMFSGTTFGGVNTTSVYYLTNVTNSTFTLSSTGSPTATPITNTAGSGNMTLTIQSGNNYIGIDVNNAIKSPLNTNRSTYTITSATGGTFTYTNSSSYTYITVGSGIMFDTTAYTGLNANRMYYIATTPTSTTFTLTGVSGVSGSAPMNGYVYTVTTPYIISYATNTNNTFRCDNTIGLFAGTPVQFLGSIFGGIVSTTTVGSVTSPKIYYIISSNLTATTFSVSETSGGSAVTLTGTSYGSMFMSIVYQCTATATNGNISLNGLVADNLTRLFVGQMVQFFGTLIGGLVAGRTYFVVSVSISGSSGTITVSTTLGGSVVTLTTGTSSGFGMIMTTGYFTTPSSQSLITLDLYNVSIMPYNTNPNTKILRTPILLQIQTAKVYTMPNASTGFTIDNTNTTAASISTNLTLSSDQIPNGISWSGTASTTNSPYSGIGTSAVTLSGSSPTNLKVSGLLGNTLYYLQFIGTGFSTAEYTSSSYSVITANQFRSTNASLAFLDTSALTFTSGTYSSVTVNWTAIGFASGTTGTLYISYSNSTTLPITPISSSGTISNQNLTLNKKDTGTILNGYGNQTYYAILYYPAGNYSSGNLVVSSLAYISPNASLSFNAFTNTTSYTSVTVNWTALGFASGTTGNLYISIDSTTTNAIGTFNNIDLTLNKKDTGTILNGYGNQTYYAILNYSGTYSSQNLSINTPYRTPNASLTSGSISNITYNSAKFSWTTGGLPTNTAGKLYISISSSTVDAISGGNNIDIILNSGSNSGSYTTATILTPSTNYYIIIKYSTGTYSTSDVYATSAQFKTLDLGGVTFSAPTGITYNQITFNYTITGYNATDTYYTVYNSAGAIVAGGSTSKLSATQTSSITITNLSTTITGGLYNFSPFIFTNANIKGPNGPTLAQLTSNSNYSSQSWTQNTNYLNMTTQGIQIWTVPITATYTIIAGGAAGAIYGAGSGIGGNGIIIFANVQLTVNQKILILVGHMGPTETQVWHAGGGGGGGTFVATTANTLLNATPILVAGGGGGGWLNGQGDSGVITTYGTAGSSGGIAGSNGNRGGTVDSRTDNPGAGFYTGLSDGTSAAGFINGGTGGYVNSDPGGFGGGGGAGGGGGGGYSGGGGTASGASGGCGGGGSYDITNSNNGYQATQYTGYSGGYCNGDGFVQIGIQFFYIQLRTTANNYGQGDTFGTNSGNSSAFLLNKGNIIFNQPTFVRYNQIVFNYMINGYSITDTSYTVYVFANNTSTPVSGLSNIKLTSTQASSITITGLSPNTFYYIQLTTLANNYGPASTFGTNSGNSSATTLTASITFNAPSQTYNTITFNIVWNNYTDGIYSIYNNNGTILNSYNNINISSYTTSIIVTGLSSNTRYYINLTTTENNYGASITYGNNTLSNSFATTYVQSANIIFSPPTNITFYQVTFNYTITSYNVTDVYYTLYQNNNINYNYYLIRLTSTQSSSITFIGLNPGTKYHITLTTAANDYGPGGTFGGGSGNSSTNTYGFTSFTFTNIANTGTTGPTLAQLRANSTYSAQLWTLNDSYFNATATGIQLWTAPFTGSYQFIVAGAACAATNSYGLIVFTQANLVAGDIIGILVGQMGTGLGGGGASYLVRRNTVILVGAGPGGSGTAPTTTPTLNGGSGGSANTGSGGAGYSGAGANGTESTGGIAYTSGGVGGGSTSGNYGGFGGGGGGGVGTGYGGGGGYNGGNGGYGYSSGGTCYDVNNTNRTATLYSTSITANGGTYINGQCKGHGFVRITKVTNTTQLYSFTEFVFNYARITNRFGPTLTDLMSDSTYSSLSWTFYIDMTTQGIQLWTVPVSAKYQIFAAGAAGGNGGGSWIGGRGVIISRTNISLNMGDVLKLGVGVMGTSGRGGGGGGASYVIDSNNNPILIAAGGGGGPSSGDNPTTAAVDARYTSFTDSGGGGKINQPSGWVNYAGGGGGLTGNGGDGYYNQVIQGGRSFTNGSTGGNSNGVSDGGFGGGGAGGPSGGGGGGYKGGDAGNWGASFSQGGEGGYSYDKFGTNNNGTLYIGAITGSGGTYTNGYCTGNGFILIRYIGL